MWEEGARIYGTPGVYNNFPDLRLENIHTKKKKNHLKQPNEIKVLAYPPVANSQI